MALDNSAAIKTTLSEINGPKFSIVTKALSGGTDESGKRRFRATASSTITDYAGDEITLPALEKMAQKFRQGLTIFMDHDFKHVDSAFGLTDDATIIQRGVDGKGVPVWDLDISGVVNTPNPRAVQLADSIDGGFVKLGASITAFVREHARKKQGGMLISDLDVFEASVVGVPENQRSWAQKAALAIKSFNFTPEDNDEEMTVAEDQEQTETVVSKGDLSAAARNKLPDSAFACPEQHKYPIHDAAHVRAALSRIADPSNDQCGRDKIIAAAKKMGIGEHAAKSLDTDDALVKWAATEFPADRITVGEDGLEAIIISKDIDGEAAETHETHDTIDACPTCGQSRETTGCSDGYHAAETSTDAETAEATPGVQESAQETPETTPTATTEADTPDLEKAASVTTDDVAALVKQVGILVTEIDRLRGVNATLLEQVEVQKQLNQTVSNEVELAKQVISKVMERPLQAKTAGFVKEFTKAHDLFDPEIAEYLNKRGIQ
jgi:hypothetical protein